MYPKVAILYTRPADRVLTVWNTPPGTRLSVPSGVTFSHPMAYPSPDGQPVDLTSGYSAAGMLRKRPADPVTVLQFASGGSGITLQADGTVIWALTATETAQLAVGRYVWSVLVTGPDTEVILIDYGTLEVLEDTVRS